MWGRWSNLQYRGFVTPSQQSFSRLIGVYSWQINTYCALQTKNKHSNVWGHKKSNILNPNFYREGVKRLYSHDDVPKLWGGGMSRKFDDFVTIVVVGFPHDYEFYKSKAMMFALHKQLIWCLSNMMFALQHKQLFLLVPTIERQQWDRLLPIVVAIAVLPLCIILLVIVIVIFIDALHSTLSCYQ